MKAFRFADEKPIRSEAGPVTLAPLGARQELEGEAVHVCRA